MAKAGSRTHRARRARGGTAQAAPALITRAVRREDALVEELWTLDHAIGVRNLILARLQAHLTEGERAELALPHHTGFDIDQCAIDLAGFQFDHQVAR